MAWNFCPWCGHRAFQHGVAGCVHKTQMHHIARFTNEGVTVKHPLAERVQDKLFDCTVLNDVIGTVPPSWVKPGDYAIIENSDGTWSFEPLDKATEQCGCSAPHSSLVSA